MAKSESGFNDIQDQDQDEVVTFKKPRCRPSARASPITLASNLRTHLKRHSGEKPVQASLVSLAPGVPPLQAPSPCALKSDDKSDDTDNDVDYPDDDDSDLISEDSRGNSIKHKLSSKGCSKLLCLPFTWNYIDLGLYFSFYRYRSMYS